MKKYKNQGFVLQGDVKYIHHPAKEEDGTKTEDITIGIATIAIPINLCNLSIVKNSTDKLIQLAKGLSGVSFKFDWAASAYIVTISAKTQLRGEDVYDEELGRKIVDSKIQSMALKVVKRIIVLFRNCYIEEVQKLQSKLEYVDTHIYREENYRNKVLYKSK